MMMMMMLRLLSAQGEGARAGLRVAGPRQELQPGALVVGRGRALALVHLEQAREAVVVVGAVLRPRGELVALDLRGLDVVHEVAVPGGHPGGPHQELCLEVAAPPCRTR